MIEHVSQIESSKIIVLTIYNLIISRELFTDAFVLCNKCMSCTKCLVIFDTESAASPNYNRHWDIWVEAMSVLQSLTKVEA